MKENTSRQTLLLIDKTGTLAEFFLDFLPPETFVVVSSGKQLTKVREKSAWVHLRNTFPSLPDVFYSHMLVFYQGEAVTKKLIKRLLAKAMRDNARLLFVVPLFYATDDVISEMTKIGGAGVIVLGELFGHEVFHDETRVGQLFQSAKEAKTIRLRNAGTDMLYPLFWRDAFQTLAQMSFAQNLEKRTYLFPKHGLTELSFARVIQQANPLVKISFIATKQTAPVYKIDSTAAFPIQTPYPFAKKLQEAGLLTKPNKKTTPKKEKKSLGAKKYVTSFASLFVFVFFCLPAITTIILGVLGVWQLTDGKTNFLKAHFLAAKNNATQAKFFFTAVKPVSDIVSSQLSMVGVGHVGAELQQNIVFGEDAAGVLSDGSMAAEYFRRVFEEKSASPKDDFFSGVNNAKKALIGFQKLQTEKKTILPENIASLGSFFDGVIDGLPTLFGFEGKKLYLVLFQNNMELRPGGGFIGSYGLLSVDQARVNDFVIHDVYDADGQLIEHIEPPFPLRRYLPQVHWYMRDANFSPDFPKSASYAANMLNIETGQAVDGVIGIDVSFAKKIVEALGSVTVPDYGETVTGDNFYLLTQSHTEKNFFAGSTQKKDFLKSLFHAISLKLSENPEAHYIPLLEALVSAAREKHVVFAFRDPPTQKLFTANSLSSTIVESRSEDSQTINDFLGISEANIGVNKANFFLARKVEQNVTLDDAGYFNESVTIRYKNDGSAWPGGDYKNYLRLIVPLGSVLRTIMIDGQQQTITPAVTNFTTYERSGFTPPQGLEVETVVDSLRTTYGFLVVVPKNSFKTITVVYTLAKRMSYDEPLLTYNLWYYKQPGTDVYPYNLSVAIPQGFVAYKTNDDQEILGGQVQMKKNLLEDLRTQVSFSKE